jgi:hypothetical protein
MIYEFDRGKSRINKEKHGIDFNAIQSLWDDPDYLVIPARTVDESRSLVIGKIDEKIWTCVTTQRGEKIRIISARRARDEEKELYESP